MENLFDRLSRFTGIHAYEYDPPAAEDNEVTLDVRGFRQVDTFSCGACAGASIVSTFHPELSFDDFYEVLRPKHGEGVCRAQLTRALRKCGVGYKTREHMSFKQIKKSIDAGRPIIVGLLSEHGQDHWSVIYGYGEFPDRVMLINRSGNPLYPARVGWAAFDSSFQAVRGPAIQCWGK